jgi:hypothetical protein
VKNLFAFKESPKGAIEFSDRWHAHFLKRLSVSAERITFANNRKKARE